MDSMDVMDLSFTGDHEWLLMLKENKYDEALTFLKSKTSNEQQRLVNGTFIEASSNDLELELEFPDVGHPWCIAALHGSNGILELLYQ
jgi:hypothetical protein